MIFSKISRLYWFPVSNRGALQNGFLNIQTREAYTLNPAYSENFPDFFPKKRAKSKMVNKFYFQIMVQLKRSFKSKEHCQEKMDSSKQ